MAKLSIVRRTLLQGLGVGCCLRNSFRRPPGRIASRGHRPRWATQSDIWSNEYWAKKGEVSLYMFRKRLGAPKPGEPPRPVLFLVHGSSNSARTSFDMTVPGVGEYSMMNVFARYGFDVWTMDHEGYGRSSRTGGNSDIASGVEDLKAGVQRGSEGDRRAEDAFLRRLVGRSARRRPMPWRSRSAPTGSSSAP